MANIDFSKQQGPFVYPDKILTYLSNMEWVTGVHTKVETRKFLEKKGQIYVHIYIAYLDIRDSLRYYYVKFRVPIEKDSILPARQMLSYGN